MESKRSLSPFSDSSSESPFSPSFELSEDGSSFLQKLEAKAMASYLVKQKATSKLKKAGGKRKNEPGDAEQDEGCDKTGTYNT